jgi:hypothetical protein
MAVKKIVHDLLGWGIDIFWGVGLYVLVILTILFATGVTARFIYTNF